MHISDIHYLVLGVISNLFTRDEQAEIIQELTPIMKRENPKRTLTHENVMEHFLVRTCQNLHVVFCFSPVSVFIIITIITVEPRQPVTYGTEAMV